MSLVGIYRSLRFFLHGNNHQGKVACETTSWFYVVRWACHPVRLQDSQIINIFVKKLVVFFFLHRENHRGRVASETTTFLSVVACCVSYPIILKDIFNFLHGSNYQGKVAFKTTTLGWVLSGLTLGQSCCRNSLIINISLRNQLNLLKLFHVFLHQMKNGKSFTKLLLHGDDRYDSETSKIIILASITFIYSIKRLDGQLV